MKMRCILLSFLLLSSISASATTPENISTLEEMIKPEAYSDRAHAITRMSEDKKYRVKLYSSQHPLPLGKIHGWMLKVELADGKPLEQAKIYVHGGMPVHRHGFPTNPRVTKYLGNGYYQVDGIKFSMSGDWEMRFNIKEPHQRDRVIFNIKI